LVVRENLKKGRNRVPKVQVSENEPLDKALKRLKKKIEREGILKILKQRKHYEKPSEKRRRKERSSKNKKKKF
jgi:small subunit ribosomal protein S21